MIIYFEGEFNMNGKYYNNVSISTKSSNEILLSMIQELLLTTNNSNKHRNILLGWSCAYIIWA